MVAVVEVVSAVADVVVAAAIGAEHISNPTWHVFDAACLYPWQMAPPPPLGFDKPANGWSPGMMHGPDPWMQPAQASSPAYASAVLADMAVVAVVAVVVVMVVVVIVVVVTVVVS